MNRDNIRILRDHLAECVDHEGSASDRVDSSNVFLMRTEYFACKSPGCIAGHVLWMAENDKFPGISGEASLERFDKLKREMGGHSALPYQDVMAKCLGVTEEHAKMMHEGRCFESGLGAKLPEVLEYLDGLLAREEVSS